MTLEAREAPFDETYAAACARVRNERARPADVGARVARDAGARAVHRPTNVARTVFHVASGVVALAMVQLLPTRGWLIVTAGAFALFAWACEVLRRGNPRVNARLMGLFGRVAHPHEWREVNSATWYATALVIMASFVPLGAASVGVVVLAVADPLAGIIGRRFGRVRLSSGRSLEGAMAFVAGGTLAAYGWMAATGSHPDIRLALALVGAVSGAVIELFVKRLDDNFAIPLGSSASVAIVAALLG